MTRKPSPGGNPPSSIRVINRRLVQSLARALDIPLDVSVSTESEIGIAKVVAGKVKQTRSDAGMSSDDPRLVPDIVTALRESGQLNINRPDTPEEFWRGEHDGWYVYERVLATPVVLPLKDRLPDAVTGPDALTVWVADPPEPVMPRDEWDFSTSFLFIVEELGEFRWPIGWFLSGISALRIVAEVLTDPRPDTMSYDSLHQLAASPDRFGRWQGDHPVERLRGIGGVVGRSRIVDTVYKIEYMTDEQSYPYKGAQLRVSDILAYPLYIAE
ncbi:hypothetical protein [Microbacterium paraoxydans]|uniref:hypothetical protein n=1 Tax=Microbacterium paraoxydans TaxID=199592 RepID=UPI0011A48948|nr:hypothetical protein [Microbacterium paraoxydans]